MGTRPRELVSEKNRPRPLPRSARRRRSRRLSKASPVPRGILLVPTVSLWPIPASVIPQAAENICCATSLLTSTKLDVPMVKFLITDITSVYYQKMDQRTVLVGTPAVRTHLVLTPATLTAPVHRVTPS